MKIKIYDDYHQIEPTKTCNVIELGCFPAKKADCCKYFAVFYNRNSLKPKFEDLKSSLFKKINFNKVGHYRTGMDISVSKKEVEESVKESLKNHI